MFRLLLVVALLWLIFASGIDLSPIVDGVQEVIRQLV